MPVFLVYIARMKDGRLYDGHTVDSDDHTAWHREGKGSRTTRIWGFDQVLYAEPHADRASAIRRERQLKGWSRAKKLALARGDRDELKRLARSTSTKSAERRA